MNMWVLHNMAYEDTFALAVSADLEKLKAHAVERLHPKSKKLQAQKMEQWKLDGDEWHLYTLGYQPWYLISEVEVIG